MRKLLLAALAAAVAVAGFTAVSQAGAGEAGTSWEFKYKPAKKARRPAPTASSCRPSRWTTAASRRRRSRRSTSRPAPRSTPRCPRAARRRLARSVRRTATPARRPRSATATRCRRSARWRRPPMLKAYNRKKGILFLIIAVQPGHRPRPGRARCTPLDGGTFALEGKLKYQDKAKTKPFLVVPTPQTLLDGQHHHHEVPPQDEQGSTDSGDTYIESPPKCKKGKFKTKAVISTTAVSPVRRSRTPRPASLAASA